MGIKNTTWRFFKNHLEHCAHTSGTRTSSWSTTISWVVSPPARWLVWVAGIHLPPPHHKIDRLLHDRWTLWNFSALEILSKRGRDPIRSAEYGMTMMMLELHKIPRKLIPFHVCIRKGQQPRKIPIIYLYCSHTQKMWTYLDLIFQYHETYGYATYGPEYL